MLDRCQKSRDDRDYQNDGKENYCGAVVTRGIIASRSIVRCQAGRRDNGAACDVLIYCRDHRCSHHVETNADGWPDDVRLSDIEP